MGKWLDIMMVNDSYFRTAYLGSSYEVGGVHS